jgi:AAA domain
MPTELRIMESEPPIAKLKLALVGKEKNGKSRLAATGRKPVLVHDFDNRAEALQGIPGVYVISYVDSGWPIQPSAAQDFLTNISKLEESLDLHKLGFKVPPETCVKTNVVDSIVTFGAAFQRYALYNSKDIRRELTIGSMKVFLPGGWDAWNAEMVPVENAVLRLLAMPTDTIIILHETAEEAADSSAEKPKFTGRVGVFPVRYGRLIKYFNEVWRVRLEQSVGPNGAAYRPKVYPLPTYEFDAASTMNLDKTEDPDITAMIRKHENKLLGQGAPKEQKAVPQLKL